MFEYHQFLELWLIFNKICCCRIQIKVFILWFGITVLWWLWYCCVSHKNKTFIFACYIGYLRYIEERSFRRFVEACLEETVIVYVDHLLIQVFISHWKDCFCLYSPVIYIVIFILQHDEPNDACDFRETISRKIL